MAKNFKNNKISEKKEKFVNEREVRELISASLANWTGITRFRTVETSIVSLTDFTDAQHNHENAAGGGQLDPANALSAVVPVNKGGTGVNTITGVVKGNGAGAFTAVVPLAGTKIYYVADTAAGNPTRKLTFTDGILTAET